MVTIEIAPEARQLPGLEVRCGSVLVDASQPSIAIPVDPGELLIEARAPGYAPVSKRFEVPPKWRGSVQIPALTPVETPAAGTGAAVATAPTGTSASTAPVQSQDGTQSTSTTKEPLPVLPIVLGGVGVVGLGVGTYFGITAMSDADEANDLCPNGECSEPRGEELMDDARNAATVSNVAFGVGAACIVTGLVIYLVGSDEPSASEQAFLPFVEPHAAGLEWRGSL
jgi:serine/threonine-protein kinase